MKNPITLLVTLFFVILLIFGVTINVIGGEETYKTILFVGVMSVLYTICYHIIKSTITSTQSTPSPLPLTIKIIQDNE